jgi:ferredoxin
MVDPRDARAPITPPGSLDRRRFSSRCTACHLCVASCPTQVLRPSLLEYGLSGLLQPRLVYDGGACVYDCDLCGQVCPAGAILPLPLPEKRLVQVGRARFVKADCVVETRKKVCGACAEHCPTKAIAMVPYAGEPQLRIPELNEEACIGCGACEHPCPVQPRKAIWVEARSPHGRAKKIEPKPIEKPPAGDEGFPF